jgi:hypothetical protein
MSKEMQDLRMNFKVILNFLGLLRKALNLFLNTLKPKQFRIGNKGDYESLRIDLLGFLDKLDRYRTSRPDKLAVLCERKLTDLHSKLKHIEEQEEVQLPLEYPDIELEGRANQNKTDQ